MPTTTKSTTKKDQASTSKSSTAKSTAAKSSTTTKKKSEQSASFQGKFTPALGRRKKSVAQVRIYPQKGSGVIQVNGQNVEDYFDEDRANLVYQPLKLTSHLKDLDISILVEGGGVQGQAEAIRLGISRALIKHDSDLTASLKAKGWTTRDPRRKERKKPGLKKARRSPQWSKR